VFFRGVINSDTPKWVSRFVTPLQGVSRFATVPWAVSQKSFCFFKQKGKQGKQSKQGQQSQQSQP
jgi:hypothetical protein